MLPVLICITSIGTDLSRSQVDILLLFAIAVSMYLASRKREIAAGIFLAFPAAVKLYPALLFFHPLCRRNWRMVTGVVIGLLLALVLLPAAVLGAKRTSDLYHTWANVILLPGIGRGTDTSRAAELTSMGRTDNQSLLALIHNWTYHSG